MKKIIAFRVEDLEKPALIDYELGNGDKGEVLVKPEISRGKEITENMILEGIKKIFNEQPTMITIGVNMPNICGDGRTGYEIEGRDIIENKLAAEIFGLLGGSDG